MVLGENANKNEEIKANNTQTKTEGEPKKTQRTKRKMWPAPSELQEMRKVP